MVNDIKGHNESVRSVNFSPDGTKLASGSDDKTIIIWDMKTK
jgi:WD40 repeat protein